MPPILSINDVTKAFNGARALRGVSFDADEAEIVAVLGPSGCGKSTLLHLVAGLGRPDSGDVRWRGQSILEVPPHRRGFGLMFQDFALFPHLDVAANVGFGLRYLETTPEAAHSRIAELLDLVGLTGFEPRDVDSLSGGEQQRVALARALAPAPQLLMLDEPLGALDRTLRERLLSDLDRILRSLGQTALYVTHDQEEAFAIADRVVVMRAGRVEQVGTPRAIYQSPATPFVARFLGFGNFIAGRMMDGQLRTDFGRIPLNAGVPDGKVAVLLRPDGASFPSTGAGLEISGTVLSKSFRGSTQQAHITGGMRFDFPADIDLPAVGDPIRLDIEPGGVQIFEDSGA